MSANAMSAFGGKADMVWTSRNVQILAYEISDDALENAASIGRAGNYTVLFCTAFDLCPGP